MKQKTCFLTKQSHQIGLLCIRMFGRNQKVQSIWRVITNEDEAKIRMQKTIEFQKTHDTYLIYEKVSGEAIGFAGIEQLGPLHISGSWYMPRPQICGKRIR